jgi:hypothetical protein
MLPGSEGSFINRDSRGDHSIIEPGGPSFHQRQVVAGYEVDGEKAFRNNLCNGRELSMPIVYYYNSCKIQHY